MTHALEPPLPIRAPYVVKLPLDFAHHAATLMLVPIFHTGWTA